MKALGLINSEVKVGNGALYLPDSGGIINDIGNVTLGCSSLVTYSVGYLYMGKCVTLIVSDLE